MAYVVRSSALRASRPWSYSLIDNIDYKQHLTNAQNMHEVNVLVDEAMRSSIVADRELAKHSIIAKRSTDQITHAIAAVGGMTAGTITDAITRSSDTITRSSDAITGAVARSGQVTVAAIQDASAANIEALEVIPLPLVPA